MRERERVGEKRKKEEKGLRGEGERGRGEEGEREKEGKNIEQSSFHLVYLLLPIVKCSSHNGELNTQPFYAFHTILYIV